jgi:hypothetical protein
MPRAADARALLAIGLAALSLVMASACASVPRSAAPPLGSPMAASPSPAPSLSPSPVSAAAALAPAANLAVHFSGLPAGTYPVHVHSRCSGNQAFHIVVVQSLRVSSAGAGSIEVPRGYAGRGLCLIVYANPGLSAVLTTRPI